MARNATSIHPWNGDSAVWEKSIAGYSSSRVAVGKRRLPKSLLHHCLILRTYQVAYEKRSHHERKDVNCRFPQRLECSYLLHVDGAAVTPCPSPKLGDRRLSAASGEAHTPSQSRGMSWAHVRKIGADFRYFRNSQLGGGRRYSRFDSPPVSEPTRFSMVWCGLAPRGKCNGDDVWPVRYPE